MRRIGTFWPVVAIILLLCAGILYLENKLEHAQQRCGSSAASSGWTAP